MSCLQRILIGCIGLLFALTSYAQNSRTGETPQTRSEFMARADYLLGPGDVVKISVFQSADLSIETRIGESGFITYPLLGNLRVAGLTVGQTEALIAKRLKEGNYLQNPSVNMAITQFRSQQVSVLGNVNRPGRYPLETTGTRLTDILALAGGASPGASDTVIISSEKDGKRRKLEVDLPAMFLEGNFSNDITLQAGDVVYVHRGTSFYVHGQIQRPGAYPIERGMTIGQAIAKGGGIAPRGREKGIRVTRVGSNGVQSTFEPKMEQTIQADDLIFVPESLF